MPMYDLIEYSNNYSKKCESLWQYYRDESHAAVVNSESFKSKIRITGKTPADDNTRSVEKIPLKYLSIFWRTLEILLIKCAINLILTSSNCVITSSTSAEAFSITYAKHYVSVVTLATVDNARLLQGLKSSFKKKTVKWNEHQSKVTIERQNEYLDNLIDPRFQGLNTLFALSFENNANRTGNTEYFLPKLEMKDYNVMIKGQNLFQ